MILNLSSNSWFKLVLIIGGLSFALVGWAWVSGYFFLELAGLDGVRATPLILYRYWYYYGGLQKTGALLCLAGIGGLFPIGLLLLTILTPRRRKLFGTAKWATARDLKDAGLFSRDGIIVGRLSGVFGSGKRYLISGGTQHVLMAAPTRSGKGVSVVIPNLLSWKDSVIVLDLKRENWDITAGFRAAHGQKCFLLNLAPRDCKTHRWNPLYYISDNPAFRINDIQKIGQMLFPKVDGEAPIWQASARSLWLGLVLYLLETPELPVTLGETLRQLTMGDKRLAEIIKQRRQDKHPLSDECYLALKEYLDTPEKTRGSVRKGFTAALELFYNPVIDAATAGNDFDLRDIRKERMSIYVAISPDDLDRLAPLINLFFQQVLDLNTRELPEQNPELRHQCLLLADEFTAMGKVGILTKGISYIAGYGLRMLPIIQSPSQLREVYGADTAETFIENHAMRIIFAPKNIKVAKEISDTLGTTTVKNRSRNRTLVGKAHRSINTSEHSRALLLPQEVMQVDKKSAILLMEYCPPIKCRRIVWYKDPVFKERGNGRDGVRWTSPIVPEIDPERRVKGKVQSVFPQLNQTTEAVVERPITVRDIERIDTMDMENFSCDFSQIEIPNNDISDKTMDGLVNQFFGCLAMV
ncbi:MAG: type IV secretory system conjugative DNA transfer family protein [Syntrophotalea sp.]|uniref:type IV secretory system conjugative DNA transfer family protein n=1 Tax=Syntrophotalea sp. TaxID=2812029 RepID=UPI003D0962BF